MDEATVVAKPSPIPLVLRWFGVPEDSPAALATTQPFTASVIREPCYYIQPTEEYLTQQCSQHESDKAEDFLRNLLGDGFTNCTEGNMTATLDTNFDELKVHQFILEVGPKLRHKTPWCTNVMNICTNNGITLDRIEMTWRYLITMKEIGDSACHRKDVRSVLFDEVLEEVYAEPITTFYDSLPPLEPHWTEIPVMAKGVAALTAINEEKELGFDDHDLAYYGQLFKDVLKRNPTNVELFDLAQSNSEHSRHWFFKGTYMVDGQQLEKSLMTMVQETNGRSTNSNNVIKFHDNSSAIKGSPVPTLEAASSWESSQLILIKRVKHLLLTAETHNFPTGVAPFCGAATGTGGRIRDVMAAGTGGTVVAGTAGYCVGQLHLDGYFLPWEKQTEYSGFFQHPQKIIIDASNGASDYGNKFGEPVIGGFFRSFGGNIGSERREYLKPIMFSAGIGLLDEKHVEKGPIRLGGSTVMIAKIGGPAYRIGIGGGSASSVMIQGASLDRTLKAVQRGDPEMGNKLNRFLRACIEMGDKNPILSIHDQGAGGNANVLKEIVSGHGADIYSGEFTLGDNSLTLEELWCAEYQESNAILFYKSNEKILQTISERERCPLDIVGELLETDRFRLIHGTRSSVREGTTFPVDFPLTKVMGDMPEKKYQWVSKREQSAPINLIGLVDMKDVQRRILKLGSVGSKRFLTSKVDRSVTGLIAQQQCVGPFQLPLSDVAVTASSYFGKTGTATSIGEQPIITLLNPCAGARMSLMEALCSIVMASITNLKDIKCSVNWMWPAKMEGEGYAMYEACQALCGLMKQIGVGVDGGKDSLSMAANVLDKADNVTTVKAPGTVVVSAYVGCDNINKVLTPDFKGVIRNMKTSIIWLRPVQLLRGRLGGSAFGQVYSKLGVETPDFTEEDAKVFVKVFPILQTLLKDGVILSCHDVSEGGMLTCLVEMCIAGNCGASIKLPFDKSQEDAFIAGRDDAQYHASLLFSEEIGWLLEVEDHNTQTVEELFAFTHCDVIGSPWKYDNVRVMDSSDTIIYNDTKDHLRFFWEETSMHLDLLQTNEKQVNQEYNAFRKSMNNPIRYSEVLTRPVDVAKLYNTLSNKTPRVGILREEGTNGDREMAGAFMMAGFHVSDITMSDIANKKLDIRHFHGLIFPGGFSYADSLGAAVGWAASIQGNDFTRQILNEWRMMDTSFSLAVCNGCQLTARLGWQEVNDKNFYSMHKPTEIRYEGNESGRFESRWSRVKISKSRSIFLHNMENAVLGIWVAHGEGKFTCEDETYCKLLSQDRVAMRYVDYNNRITSDYPHNPNGSRNSVAGISSEDGRHLALMPHPERCFMPWQCPYKIPSDVHTYCHVQSTEIFPAAWSRMFQNSFDWCKFKLDNK